MDKQIKNVTNREVSKKGFVPFELNAGKRFNDRKDAQGNEKKKPK